jgi:hypothetical protein
MQTRIWTVKLTASACLASTGLMLLPGSAHCQGGYHDLPAHSHYSATEQGWTCNDDYRQVAGFCIQDSADIPSQGPFEVYEGQWKCRSGYTRSGNFCVTPAAPAHASLLPGGGWECDWGFRKVASRCEEINPPAHAYLDASGHEWTCYPGFQRSSDHCVEAATSVREEPGGAPTVTDQPRVPATSQETNPQEANPH